MGSNRALGNSSSVCPSAPASLVRRTENHGTSDLPTLSERAAAAPRGRSCSIHSEQHRDGEAAQFPQYGARQEDREIVGKRVWRAAVRKRKAQDVGSRCEDVGQRMATKKVMLMVASQTGRSVRAFPNDAKLPMIIPAASAASACALAVSLRDRMPHRHRGAFLNTVYNASSLRAPPSTHAAGATGSRQCVQQHRTSRILP
jgi:hypothetical protein